MELSEGLKALKYFMEETMEVHHTLLENLKTDLIHTFINSNKSLSDPETIYIYIFSVTVQESIFKSDLTVEEVFIGGPLWLTLDTGSCGKTGSPVTLETLLSE